MLKLIKDFRTKDILYILISFVLIVVQVWLELKMPDYMSSITRLVQTEGTTINQVIEQGIYMLVCAFGSLISAVIVGYLASHISSSFSMNLRNKIFKKVEKFSTQEIKKFSTSSLITRTTNDVTQIEMLIGMGLQLLIKAPIMAVWAITKILDKSVEWSMLVGICVIILLMTIPKTLR